MSDIVWSVLWLEQFISSTSCKPSHCPHTNCAKTNTEKPALSHWSSSEKAFFLQTILPMTKLDRGELNIDIALNVLYSQSIDTVSNCNIFLRSWEISRHMNDFLSSSHVSMFAHSLPSIGLASFISTFSSYFDTFQSFPFEHREGKSDRHGR